MMVELIARANKPDAIYYANDHLAAGRMMRCILTSFGASLWHRVALFFHQREA